MGKGEQYIKDVFEWWLKEEIKDRFKAVIGEMVFDGTLEVELREE